MLSVMIDNNITDLWKIILFSEPENFAIARWGT